MSSQFRYSHPLYYDVRHNVGNIRFVVREYWYDADDSLKRGWRKFVFIGWKNLSTGEIVNDEELSLNSLGAVNTKKLITGRDTKGNTYIKSHLGKSCNYLLTPLYDAKEFGYG